MLNRVLVTRVDRLGDFCHTLPALSLLRRSLPEVQIDLLLHPNMMSLAKEFSFSDRLIAFESADMKGKYLAQCDYSHALIFNDHSDVVKQVKNAGVPVIVGQKRGWSQWRYTHRFALKRSKCVKPEWRYCIDHVEAFLNLVSCSPCDIRQRDWDLSNYRFAARKVLADSSLQILVFIHPGSGGSEPSLSEFEFSEIALLLSHKVSRPIKFVVTQGPDESNKARKLNNLLTEQLLPSILLPYDPDLSSFLHTLAAADVMLAGSTGPLHLASLHNAITVGFYTEQKRNLKVRWSTLSDESRRLAFAPPPGKKTGNDMSLISIQQVVDSLATMIN